MAAARAMRIHERYTAPLFTAQSSAKDMANEHGLCAGDNNRAAFDESRGTEAQQVTLGTQRGAAKRADG
jgi:hypothetical protein